MMAALASLVLALLVGVSADRAFFGAPGGWSERLGRGLLLGFALLGMLSLFADLCGVGVSRWTVVVPALVVSAALAWGGIRRARVRVTPAQEDGSRAAARARCALDVVSVVVAMLLLRSGWIRPVFQFDAITRWMLKAKVLAHEGTLLGALSTEPEYWFTHQRYPPLVSHVANLPALFSGAFDERAASFLFPCFVVGLVLVLRGWVARHATPLRGACAAFWFLTLPLVLYRSGPPPGSGAFSALADLPLAAFLALASFALVDEATGRRPRAWLEAGLFLGAAALTKNEGIPFLLGGVLALFVARGRVRWQATVAAGVLGATLFGVLWGWMSRGLPALDEHYPGRLSWEAVQEGVGRLPWILARLGEETVSVARWNAAWPLWLGLLLLAGRKAMRRAPRLLVVAAILQIGVYVLALTISGWSNPLVPEGEDPVGKLLDLTAGRLLLHVAPLALSAALIAGATRRPEEDG